MMTEQYQALMAMFGGVNLHIAPEKSKGRSTFHGDRPFLCAYEMKYTDKGRLGQDSKHLPDEILTGERVALLAILHGLEDEIAALEEACQNANFVKKSDAENHPEKPAAQGDEAPRTTRGVVKGSIPSTPIPPTIPTPIPPTFPTNLPTSPSTLIPTTSAESRPLSLRERIEQRLATIPKRYLKRRTLTVAWDRLSSEEKFREKFRHAELCEATAFSLNLNKRREAKLLQSDDPANALAKEINRYCRKELGYLLPLVFTFEFSPSGRLHVHGFAVLPDWEPDTIRNFRLALKKAGGKIEGLGSGRQIHAGPLYDWKGWQGYRLKDAARTIATLGTDKISYCSRELTRAAREAYEAELTRQKAARRARRQRKPSLRARTAVASHQQRLRASASLGHSPAARRAVWTAMSQRTARSSRRQLASYCWNGRPRSIIDPSLRSAGIHMKIMPSSAAVSSDISLIVSRHSASVPTPGLIMMRARSPAGESLGKIVTARTSVSSESSAAIAGEIINKPAKRAISLVGANMSLTLDYRFWSRFTSGNGYHFTAG